MKTSLNEADQRAALLRVALDRPGPIAPKAEDFGDWLTLARMERVVPLLFRLVDTTVTDLDDDQRETTRLLQGTVLSHCVQLEHHLLAVTHLLTRNRIPSVVLKGAATAHVDYPDPVWRGFADIDLLIGPEHMAGAIELLRGDGWTQRYALPGGHERFTHAITLVYDGLELDLHQRVGHRAIGLRVPTRDLLASRAPFEIAGVSLSALDPRDRLIHSALHAVTSRAPNRRLSSTADVLRQAESLAPSAADVLERAERWRVRSLVERGVCDAYGAAQVDVDGAWSAAMRRPIRSRDRLVDRAYLAHARRPLTEEVAYLRLLHGWSTRWRYVSGYFEVHPEYATQTGRSGIPAQVGYVISKLRRGDR